jgi:DNA replication protein DnaC
MDVNTLDSFIPKFTRGLKIGEPDLAERVERKEAIAETLAAMASKNKIVLVGGSGSGKSSLAAAAFRERIEAMGVQHQSEILFVNAHRLVIDNDRRIRDAAISAKLLVIDDLGQDPLVQMTPIPTIVIARYEECLPLWVTTWLPLGEVSRRYGEGIARRILEGARVIQCGHQVVPMEP